MFCSTNPSVVESKPSEEKTDTEILKKFTSELLDKYANNFNMLRNKYLQVLEDFVSGVEKIGEENPDLPPEFTNFFDNRLCTEPTRLEMLQATFSCLDRAIYSVSHTAIQNGTTESSNIKFNTIVSEWKEYFSNIKDIYFI